METLSIYVINCIYSSISKVGYVLVNYYYINSKICSYRNVKIVKRKTMTNIITAMSLCSLWSRKKDLVECESWRALISAKMGKRMCNRSGIINPKSRTT